jgi:two-component system NtrC family sensor kinase
LSFARQHKPERVPVQLNAIIEDTLALRDYDLRMSQICIHLHLADDLPEVAADPHQLQQVFLNLINNAVDAILEIGSEGDLWVRTGVEKHHIFVEFQDSGPGVKDASRVFDPFYTTKPVGKGTGLGLSICYGIISEHGGTILVRNEPNSGATFRLELPLRPRGTAEPTARTEPAPAARNNRILVVDQNESVLDTIARLLAENAHEVVTATSLEEARQFVGSGEFDLVLADWQIVLSAGARASKAGNGADTHGLGPRVLWMTSVEETDAQHVLPEKALLLRKPFEPVVLLAAVDAALLRAAAPLVRD